MASKFNVGDKVMFKYPNDIPENVEFGWDINMNYLSGKEATVARVEQTRRGFRIYTEEDYEHSYEEDWVWSFSEAMFEPVEEEDPASDELFMNIITG